MSRNEKIKQYDVLRVIATLLVVIGHGRYFVMETGYGGCDYSAFVDPDLISWKLVGLITEFLNAFHMQIFMGLGGALFYGSMQRSRYHSLGELAVDKTKRLLIPFLIVGTLYVFPLKLLTGYYSGSENLFRDFVVGQLLIQGNVHLWYLPAMFIDFLICYLLETYVKVPKLLKLIALALISTLMWDFPIHLVAYPLRFAVWFYAGYCFEQKRSVVDRWGTLGWGCIGCVAMAAVYLAARWLLKGGWGATLLRFVCVKWLVPALAGVSLYMVCCAVARTRVVSSRWYRSLLHSSFGIYLYSDPVNYVVLFLAAEWAAPFLFGDSLGVIVLYLLRIGASLGWAILVTAILRRCKVKYIV